MASLELTEPVGAAADVLSLSATDTAAVGVQSAFAVNVVPHTGPAFVAPAMSVTLQPNALTVLPDLLLSDPIAAGLSAMGLGKDETLSLTLSVAQGVLLLPGLGVLGGIAATGVGTGTIELSFTADEIAALNTLLAGLEFAGPHITGGQHLDYSLWNASGVLPRVVTYGNIFIKAAGTAAASGSFVTGTDTLITGGLSLFNGTLPVSGTLAMLGNLSNGAVVVAPGAALELPDNGMALTGTSLDFGALSAQTLNLSGTMLAAPGAGFANAVTLAAGARLQFDGNFTAFSGANNSLDLALQLGAGAVVEGNGTLMAGNFSQGAIMSGGTLLALGGDTLELDAGWLSGGALLQAAGGGVIVLGPVSPLYGVFDTAALNIDSSVTLSFLSAGAAAISGGYADTLGGTGGAFVLNGPQVFSGSITGFGVGDELILPGLANLSVYNIGANSFSVAGLDASGKTETYSIHTSIAAGLTPSAGKDAEGDAVLFMRPALAEVTQGAAIAAAAGVPQPLLGLSLNLAGNTTQSLTITLSASHGSFGTGGTLRSSFTLSAANVNALNAELAAVSYTGAGIPDTVLISSNTGVLAGMSSYAAINPGGTGTISGYSGLGITEAEMVSFGVAAGLTLETQAISAGGLLAAGLVEFDDVVQVQGYSGTALLADAGGDAVFGAAAAVVLHGDVTLGDVSGAGTLDVLTNNLSVSGNFTLAPVSAAAGSEAVILGAVTAAGSINIGLSATAGLVLQGSLAASGLTLGAGGSFQESGTAQAAFGNVANAGSMVLTGDATLSAAAYSGIGTLELGGTSNMAVAGMAIVGQPGFAEIDIGQGATFSTGTFDAAFGTMTDAGLLTATGSIVAYNMALDGGTLAAPFIESTGTMVGFGVVAATSLYNGGYIEAAGGRLLLTGSVMNASIMEIDTGAVLEIGGPVSDAPLYFQGINAELVLDDASQGGFGIEQMQAGDAIDLVGIAPSLVSVAGGETGRIYNSLGTQTGMFGISPSGTAGLNISITSDGNGGTLLTVDGVLPCFARGTGILTPHGYRPVESLRPNDPVITASGDRRPVRWLGWRTLDLAPDEARHARPVLVMPNAFGRGRPNKILRLSPSHCVFMDGVLIPVTHLVNGATILRDMSAQATTYYHVELDRHDVIYAEGLECESYLDDGNRAALYQELGRRSPARRAFAPIVTTGSRLASARRKLHDVVLQNGFSTSFRPVLRGLAGGETVLPEISRAGHGRIAQFTFAAPVKSLVLLSGTACPADTDPESQDRRELGICLGEMQGVRLGAGWQSRAAADAGIWMGARAELVFRRPRRKILLPLAAISPSWQRPAIDGRRVS